MDLSTNFLLASEQILRAELAANFDENNLTKLLDYSLSGNLFAFEQAIGIIFQSIKNKTMCLFFEQLLGTPAFVQALTTCGKTAELGRFTSRKTSLKVADGSTISFNSLYAYEAPKDYTAERNLFHLHFKTVGKNSPLHTSHVSSTAVLTPSFEVSAALMTEMGVKTTTTKQRDLSQTFAQKCMPNRAQLVLQPGETLADKRVIISIDGGRTRTREYKENSHKQRRKQQFETPWREPKLLVISTLDENGKANKLQLPIYDATFGDDEIFELLAQYLVPLQIQKAAAVQCTADGAPWIWKRFRPFLEALGVPAEQITETLDYFHAAEHLTDLYQYLPKNLIAQYKPIFKQLLWNGDISAIKTHLESIFPDLAQKPLKPFEYFEKNAHRMKYAEYRKNNLVCGSGIIESGIRRIINLRFKSPSAFWYKEKVEPLIFLRAAFLAGRWKFLQHNFYA
jgi:hypothetical protein